jgi:hypothetical protein
MYLFTALEIAIPAFARTATNLDSRFETNFGAPGKKGSALCLEKKNVPEVDEQAAISSARGKWA